LENSTYFMKNRFMNTGAGLKAGNIRQIILSGIIMLSFAITYETAYGATYSLMRGDMAAVSVLPDSSRPVQVFGPAGVICPGVNIHFTKGHTRDLDMMSEAGIRYIRTDMVWQDIEQEKGKYDWTAYDELTDNLEKRGIRALYILDYSNSLYEDTVSSSDPITGEVIRDIAAPAREESIAAYVRWAEAAARRYKGRNIIWEIWNEPNVSFWRPAANVEQYNRLALATLKALKNAVPESVIIGPATSQIPFDFVKSFLASGALKYLDGLSVHPYRDYALPPESVAGDYSKLGEMIRAAGDNTGKNIPVISSEWGYASCEKGLTVERQASYAVRMQLINVLSGVPLSVWYDWKNDGQSPTNFEHNCGMVSFDLSPKPAYKAISTLTSQLGGLTLAHRINTDNEKDYVVLFISRKGLFRLCAWTTDTPHQVRIDATLAHTNGLSAKDGYGNNIEVKSEKDGLILNLDELPQYITLPCGIRLD
jgi:polysaccharide biosynthesis protein PslG